MNDNERGWCRGENWSKRNELQRLVLKETEMQIRKRENETLVRPLVGPFRIRRLDGEMTLQRYKFLPFHPSFLPLSSPSNVWERVFPLGYRQDEQSIEAGVYKWACEQEKKKKKKKRRVFLSDSFPLRPPHMSSERELRSRACSSYVVVRSSAILCAVSYYSSTWVCSAHARGWSMRCKARKTGRFLAGQEKR